MARSLLADAFEHHVWASLRLLDACATLTPHQLAAPVPGTYGPILDTLRHLVGADCSYLFVLSGGRVAQIDEDTMDVPTLRSTMERNGAAWRAVLASDPDPDAILVRHRDDGSEARAPAGVRLAQALHHGTDHRSHVCTGLTLVGVEPPAIDVWDYALESGRFEETPPAS